MLAVQYYGQRTRFQRFSLPEDRRMMSVHAKAAAATFDVIMLQSADLLSPQLDRLADGVPEQSERGVCECSNASSTIKYE